MNRHCLFNSSFNIVFTRSFRVENVDRESPSRNVEDRNTALPKQKQRHIRIQSLDSKLVYVKDGGNLPPKEIGKLLSIKGC